MNANIYSVLHDEYFHSLVQLAETGRHLITAALREFDKPNVWNSKLVLKCLEISRICLENLTQLQKNTPSRKSGRYDVRGTRR